jgi:molecular chaperone Hsp33
MAGALKFSGIFTVQIQSEGPVSLLVADITDTGKMRGSARFDQERLGEKDLLGKGYLALTIDQGPHTDRYQGIVEIVDSSIEKTALSYFSQSEQIKTLFKLARRSPETSSHPTGWKATAMMIQLMPQSESEIDHHSFSPFDHARIILQTLHEHEFLDFTITPETLLYRLFHADGLTLLQTTMLQFQCRCSQSKIESTLASFPQNEIESLRDENGEITVTCEFCGKIYSLSNLKT